jgi:biotin transport system substrate-specific component
MPTNPTQRPPRSRGRTRETVVAALFAALLSASAWIVIPAGAVPVTLQVFIVLLAGLVLPVRLAGMAVASYLAVGAFGAPVFSGGGAGLAWIAGPTGGYLIGFLVAAILVALVSGFLGSRAPRVVADGTGVAIGVLAIYAVGWAQLTLVTGMGWGAAFVAGVAPFIALDVAKAVVAVAVASTLRRARVV